MEFHSYKTMRPEGYRGSTDEYLGDFFMSEDASNTRGIGTIRACVEAGWHRRERPFYNVYPIATELCMKTSLNMKWGDILLPTRYILLRFPVGNEPHGISTALLRVPSKHKESTFVCASRSRMPAAAALIRFPICGTIYTVGDSVPVMWLYHPKGDIKDEVLSDTMPDPSVICPVESCDPASHANHGRHFRDQHSFLTRLLAFIGLLANGTDLITPAILSKDREEYDSTADESRRKWLEDRASRRQGRGFDIGRSMEIERAASPHWRSRHLALFHTGPGRTMPVLKWRSGCVVTPTDLSAVPTGFLGKEKPGEKAVEPTVIFRTPVPKKMRFRVLRRDNYRCRLCGMTAADGIKLHVDHIVPVAKGGKTVERNLWALCQPCNSGKSDSDLHKAKEDNNATRKEVGNGI
jgi:hypothetical protein